jgi:hypothetical protein
MATIKKEWRGYLLSEEDEYYKNNDLTIPTQFLVKTGFGRRLSDCLLDYLLPKNCQVLGTCCGLQRRIK